MATSILVSCLISLRIVFFMTLFLFVEGVLDGNSLWHKVSVTHNRSDNPSAETVVALFTLCVKAFTHRLRYSVLAIGATQPWDLNYLQRTELFIGLNQLEPKATIRVFNDFR